VCPITVLPCSSRTGTSPRPSGKELNAWPSWQILVQVVIGVDTHKHTHTAAVVAAASGGVLATQTVATTPAGYQALVALAGQNPQPRAWAVEGTGGYGAGLARLLTAGGEWVVELDRPHRAGRRHGAKSDPIDAARAAREALGRFRLAQPRAGGQRAALGVLLAARCSAVGASTCAQRQLHALVVAAPERLRARLAGRSTRQLVAACARLGGHPSWDLECSTTAVVLRTLARRVRELNAEARTHQQAITAIVGGWRPDLLDEFGIGPITAAVVLGAWSHPGRCRSDAAFAMLGGAAPIPASSGQTVRYRLNRSGDRQLNRRCTPSCWPAAGSTRPPAPTSPAAAPRARPTGRSNAASSATSPASSTGSSKDDQPLTRHRSVLLALQADPGFDRCSGADRVRTHAASPTPHCDPEPAGCSGVDPPRPPSLGCVLPSAGPAGLGTAGRVPAGIAVLRSTGLPSAVAAADPAAAVGVGGWPASQASTAAIASVCCCARRQPASPSTSCTSMVNPGGRGRGRRARLRPSPAAAAAASRAGGLGQGSGLGMHGSLLAR
jgi:transposase